MTASKSRDTQASEAVKFLRIIREKRDPPRPFCPRCNNTGQYLMSGDLHRSEGWVPCNHN